MSPLPVPGAVLRPRPPDSGRPSAPSTARPSPLRSLAVSSIPSSAPSSSPSSLPTVDDSLVCSSMVSTSWGSLAVVTESTRTWLANECRSSMAEATPPVATHQKTTVKRLGSVAPFSESPPMTMAAESAPVTNCRMVRPREMRAMNMLAKGVQEIRQPQGAGRSDQGVHRPRVDGPVEHGRAQGGAGGPGRLRVDGVRRGRHVEVERFTDSVKNQSNAHSRGEHRGDPGFGGVLGLLGVPAQGDRAEPGGCHDSTSTVRPARQGERPTPPETAC